MHNLVTPPEDGLTVFFRKTLLQWSLLHPRPLPWKGEKDPYKIWLSEIILQQTRVEQGLPYYEKFILQYPTLRALAQAPEDELFKLWEGLGYYSRARNLHAAAKFMAFELEGKFPATYSEIRALKGVGPYSAAAIASFAYGLPHAVVDGNVYRVLARFFGIDVPTDLPAVKKQFAVLAQHLLDPKHPASYNQAIMDFGATFCTPKQPRCPDCPFQARCVAYLTNKIAELPIKSKALVKKQRQFFYLVVHFQDSLFVRKRREKDIWRGLWEFPQLDVPVLVSPFGTGKITASQPFRQLLTHQAVTAFFYETRLPDEVSPAVFDHPILEGCEQISIKNLKKNIAFPKVIDCFLQEKVLTLD